MSKKIIITPQNHRQLRDDFAILSRKSHNNHPLVYLDNAATTQKPHAVIASVNDFYHFNNANVHRSSHFLGNQASAQFEQARQQIKTFINARHSKEIIWTKGATEAINLIVNTWGQNNINKGDTILLSTMEHHANIVPWQMLAQRTGAVIKPIKLNNQLHIDLENYQQLLKTSPKIVAFCHASNALGTINPIADMINMAKRVGAVTLIDGAQATSHLPIDVQQLDCDFYVFSGHKMFAPTGVGVLYGKEKLLNSLPPWQGGGEMITSVSFQHTRYQQIPYKFEAGTPNIAGAIGINKAVEYLTQYDRLSLIQYKQQLFEQLYDYLQQQPQITIYSPLKHNIGVLSFNVEGEHHQDIGTLMDQYGIAVRTGHHCTMPLMTELGINGTIRISLSIYNNDKDIQSCINGLSKVLKLLK